jgi:hypothetical protein
MEILTTIVSNLFPNGYTIRITPLCENICPNRQYILTIPYLVLHESNSEHAEYKQGAQMSTA